MDHANDVLGVILVDRQPRVARLQALLQDLRRLGIAVDHLDAGAVQHDLLDRALGEVERAEDAVAVLLLDHALGMAQLQGAGDFLAHGKDMAVGVGLDAEDAQHPAHQNAHRAHHWRKDKDHQRDQRRHAGGGGFGVGYGIGLGQHLGEDQHQHGHHQRRERHAGFAEDPGEQRRGERGGEDVDEVVAQQHRPDQPLVVLGDLQRPFGAFRSLVHRRAQLAARGGRQRGFRAGKEPREDQQPQNGRAGDDEGGVEGSGSGFHYDVDPLS